MDCFRYARNDAGGVRDGGVNSWKIILACWTTFIFAVVGGTLLGFRQMGDCFPEPAAFSECLAAKTRAWNILSAMLAIVYLATLWLIFRRRKVR